MRSVCEGERAKGGEEQPGTEGTAALEKDDFFTKEPYSELESVSVF